MKEDGDFACGLRICVPRVFPGPGGISTDISTDIYSNYIAVRVGVARGISRNDDECRDPPGWLAMFWGWCCLMSCGTPFGNYFGNWRDILYLQVVWSRYLPIHS